MVLRITGAAAVTRKWPRSCRIAFRWSSTNENGTSLKYASGGTVFRELISLFFFFLVGGG